LFFYFFVLSSELIAQPKSSQYGKLLPLQLFTTLNDSTISLGDTSDKKFVLVDYYFAGCKPCNHNLPKLEKLKSKYGDKLIVIGINPVDSKEKTLEHQRKHEITNAIIYGKAALATRTYFGLSVTQMGFPYYIIISPEGKIIYESGNTNGWNRKIGQLIK
jgi:thiol-disulfide isomerase/thioredoxin